MAGGDRVRRCASCDKEVHDLSAIGEAEARALVLFEGPNGICVRFAHDARDAILHAAAPAPHGPARAALHRGVAAAAIGVAVAAAGCGPAAPSNVPLPADAPAAVAGAAGSVQAAAIAAPPAAIAVASAVAAPEVDGDGDGIVDREDACPAQAGKPSSDPQQNGCPARVVVVRSQGLVIVQRILFPRGGRAFTAESRAVVEEAARTLQQNPQITRLAIIGHASSDEQDAKRLGEARAKAVVTALTAAKVDPARLVVESAGHERPIANNATAEGRAHNRRVELQILDKESSCPAPGAGATP